MRWLVETLRMRPMYQRKRLILSSDTSGDSLSPTSNHVAVPQRNNARPCAKPLVSRTTTEITPSTSAISVGNKADVLFTNGSKAPRYAEVWIIIQVGNAGTIAGHRS